MRLVSNSRGQRLPAFLRALLKERWQKYRKALKRCGKKCSVDSVHQLRIETRRMLALLDLMHPFCHEKCLKDVERRFKKLFNNSAALRDVQVQNASVKKDVKSFPDLAPFIKWLRRREKRLTRQFESQVSSGVKPKLKRSLTSLKKWCRDGLSERLSDARNRHLLTEQINAGYGRVVHLRKNVDANKVSTIHRLRIAFKAYRYLIEMLHPKWIKVQPRYLKQLQTYQAMTGQIQDAEVLLALLAQFKKKKPKADMAKFRAAVKQRHSELIRRFLAVPLPPPLAQPNHNQI